MIKNIMIYLALLISAFIFNIFYYGWFSWFLLLIVIGIPVLSLILSLPFMIIGATSGITVFAKDRITVGDDFYVGISSKKWSIPFLPQLRIKLKATNKFAKTSKKLSLVYGGILNKPYYQKINYISQHCGHFEAEARYGKIYDMLGIFFIPIKINCHISCSVMPKIKKPDNKIENDTIPEIGYKPKPNGGYSEIYDIRAYRHGDRLKNIHWKLSSKLDDIVVREAIEPVYRQLIIKADFSDITSENDDILARMNYICRDIIDNNSVCYCSVDGINASTITSIDDLERYLYAVYVGKSFNICSIDKNCILYSILPQSEEVGTI